MTALFALGVSVPMNMSAPRKREWYRGARAREAGIKRNPWARSINGRNYFAFEWAWNQGWKDCDAALAKRVPKNV